MVTVLDDALAARQAFTGDGRAYAAILQATADWLRPFLRRRLQRPGDAEDVLQEILLSLHRARHTYDGLRPYKPWALAIARYRLKDHLRMTYADRLRFAEELTDAENIADPVTESAFNYESLEGEIKRLPEKQANILRLMHQEGYTAKEAGKRLNMKESAVKVAAHRAYKILRKNLER